MDDNPVARLHNLLSALTASAANNMAAESLRSVLGVEGQGQAELLEALVAFSRLPAAAERDIRARDDLDTELYLEWKPPVMHVMAHLLNSNGMHTRNMVDAIDASTLVHLKYAAHALGRTSVHLDDNQVATLADMLSDLHDTITADDALDEDLREFLLELVQRMQQAVRLVKVHGTEGLRDALRYTIGALKLSPWNDDDLPPDGQGSDVRSKFRAALDTLNTMVSISAGMYTLAAPIGGALLGIGG